MIMSKLDEFCAAGSVAHAAGTVLVGDVIDLTKVRDIGNGSKKAYLVIIATVGIITGGVAGTIAFQLVSGDVAAIPTDGSQTIHFLSKSFVTDEAIDPTDLPAGTTAVMIALPMQGPAYKRYLGIQYVVATATTTAGTINAFLTLDPKNWTSVPSAVYA